LVAKFSKRLNYYIGIWAENIVALYLRCGFYKIIAKRYKCPFGELDIVAIKGNQIIFVEVKKRADHDTESISQRSAKRIYNAASYFLAKHGNYQNFQTRVDLVQVNRFFIPKHYANYINW
jgi:putative endonuclease